MSKPSKNSDETNGITLAKLRRLKIQENVLASSINKSLSSLGLDDENFTSFKAMNEFKKYESALQKNLIEIKNLLEDVKIATDTRGDIAKLDIDEVKRDVLGLEEKLRTFKSFLRSELSSLKISAKEIQQELLINQKEKKVLKKTVTKTWAKKINEIVPSPVRIFRNSPFKCPEVQRFQEFVTSSKRYNGWNEYNHNIFIQIWNKYFHSGNGEDVTNIDDGTENTEQFHQFKDEVMAKISGISSVDIKSHYKWYSQYVYLKNKQQEALEKWKENKQKLRKQGQEAKQVSRSNRSSESSNIDKIFPIKQTFKDDSKNVASLNKKSYGESKTSWESPTDYKNQDNYDGFSRILKSTEQWRNKCQGEKDKLQLFCASTIDKRQL